MREITEAVLFMEVKILYSILFLFGVVILFGFTFVILKKKMRAKGIKHFAHKYGFQILNEKLKAPKLSFDLFKEEEWISFEKVLQGSLSGHYIEFYNYWFSKGKGNAAVLYQYSVALLNVDSKMPDFSLLKKLKSGSHISSSLPEIKTAGLKKFRLYCEQELQVSPLLTFSNKYCIEKRGRQMLIYFPGNLSDHIEAFYEAIQQINSAL